jgi:histidinol dehydrogenase
MTLDVAGVTNRREREKGFIVYPVYSRRAKGLSIGINLYPDKKHCLFNCPYCEIFPFPEKNVFSLEQLEENLRAVITAALKNEKSDPQTRIKDICFSGNGEPTLSPAFPDALNLAESIRLEMAPDAELVIITNGTGLLDPHIFSVLREATKNPSVNIWLKLDAGSPDWFQEMNLQSGTSDSKLADYSIDFEKHIAGIKEFSSCAPALFSFTIQTMLCAINGEYPPVDEVHSWESLVCEIGAAGNIRKVQLYGKARPAPKDPLASRLPDEYLEQRAASLRRLFKKNGIGADVEVFV